MITASTTREYEEAKSMLRSALELAKHEQTYVVLGKVPPHDTLATSQWRGRMPLIC